MNDLNTLAGPGDNLPPSDETLLAEIIAIRIASLPTLYEDLTARLTDLLKSASRAPDTIEDDEQNKQFATLAKLFAALVKKAEAERVGEKEVMLEGGRGVDGFFKRVTGPANNAKASLETRQTKWQLKVAAEERARRQEEERLAREEANRLAIEAARKEQAARDAKTLDDAIQAETAAKQAQATAEVAAKTAAAKPAELSRTRSDEGAVASLRTWWDFRNLNRDLIDFNANRSHIPMAAIEQMARSMIKSGIREASGMEIFENSKTVNH